MADFVSYESIKPNVSPDYLPEFNDVGELEFIIPNRIIKPTEPLVETKEEKKEEPKKQDNNKQVRYKGVMRNMVDTIKIINDSEPYNWKHYCTRAVSNALEGISNVNHSSGVADPRAMRKVLENDGWTDVLNDNYTPEVGDVWTYYSSNKKMHTSLYDGEKWISYDKEGTTPWLYSRKNDGKGRIQRFIPTAQQGMKFVKYNPIMPTTFNIIPKAIKSTYSLLKPLISKLPEKIGTEVERITEPKKYNIGTPVSKVLPPTKATMLNLYTRILLEKGIDTSYAKWLVAQDVAESGHNYEHSSGRFNFGGIKGEGSTVTTHEYINGKKTKVLAKFKDYDSPEEYARDKVRMMNDKYHAFEGDYANHLKGYATNPNYAGFVRAVYKSLGI